MPAVALAQTATAAARPADLAAYMKARAADAAGQVDDAAAGYARALSASPANSAIAGRAYREALAVGDIGLARRAAAVLGGSAEATPDLALLPLAEAAARNDPAGAEAAVVVLDGGVLRVLSPALRGWIAFARGRDPRPVLDAAIAAKEPVASHFAAEHRALLMIARGDVAGGIAAVATTRRGDEAVDLRAAAAQLLFAGHHADAARALLTGDDPVLSAMRAGDPAQPTLGFGVSRLLTGLAADLIAQAPSPLGLALARTALIADPANDRARLLIGQALARDGAPVAALQMLGEIRPGSPFATTSAAARIVILADAGRDAEALDLAHTRAIAADASPDDWQRYGERLVAAHRYAEAAPWYHRVTDQVQPGSQWAAWVQYGGVLEQAGDWPGARAALDRAVALGPSQPLALNYLGYAKATRGEDVAAARAMLERAHALAPDNLSIVDSLGWAYHLGGDTRRALPMLEQAAVGEPTNAEIAEHLGDAYWRLGRRYEARYQWRAAAITADAADQPRLTSKITNGLPPR